MPRCLKRSDGWGLPLRMEVAFTWFRGRQSRKFRPSWNLPKAQTFGRIQKSRSTLRFCTEIGFHFLHPEINRSQEGALKRTWLFKLKSSGYQGLSLRARYLESIPRGPNDHVNTRILQAIVSGIRFFLGLSTGMWHPYVYVYFGAFVYPWGWHKSGLNSSYTTTTWCFEESTSLGSV